MYTPITEVNIRGVSGIKLVKMNSNRVRLHLVKMYKASVTPRSLELTVFDVIFKTLLYPIAGKNILGKVGKNNKNDEAYIERL